MVFIKMKALEGNSRLTIRIISKNGYVISLKIWMKKSICGNEDSFNEIDQSLK